jgi:hypothetical protein
MSFEALVESVVERLGGICGELVPRCKDNVIAVVVKKNSRMAVVQYLASMQSLCRNSP